MLKFEPLSLQNAATLHRFLEKQPYRVADNTVGAVFMWRDFLQTAYVVLDNMVIFRFLLSGEDTRFTFPVGDGDVMPLLDELEIYCRESGTPLRFAGVPEGALPLLKARYGARLQTREWRDSAEYLYTAETFLSFPGRHLAGQRNHTRRFWAAHPDCRYEPLTDENLPAALEFIRAFCREHAEGTTLSAIETEEGIRSRELLCHAKVLGITGGMLTENGTVLAVAAGEIMGDTLYVHIEKADTVHTGIYQAVSQSFAQHMINDSVKYINREDDAGDAGLRRSKLSYRPCALLKKYSVTVKT